MTHPVAAEIIDLARRMKKLASFAPGQGYDEIGLRLSALTIEPRSDAEALQIMHEMESVSPGIYDYLRNVSIQSEIELELSQCQKALSQSTRGENLFTCLMEDYPYHWYEPRARLEASLISSVKPSPEVLILGNCGIPHSGMALQRVRNCNITWLDPYATTREAGQALLDALDDSISIDLLPYDVNTPLPDKDYSHALCHDSRIVNAQLMKKLRDHGIPSVSLSVNHGLVRLLYHEPDLAGADTYYHFDKGYYPPHLRNMTESGWSRSDDLSYGSIAVYKKV